MARKRVVSRTVTTTVVTTMVTDVAEEKVAYLTVSVAGIFRTEKSQKELEKRVKKIVEHGTIKFNCIIETHEEEALYKMDEDQFLALATKETK